MRVDRLTVRNFRNLADIDLRLLPGAVIVGENRSGKSNLLHAIRLVLDPTLPNSDRYLRREDFWDGLSDGSAQWDPMAAGQIIEVSVEIADFEEEPAVIAALGDALLAGEPMRARLTYRWAPRDTGQEPDGTSVSYTWKIFGGENEDLRVGAELREYLFLSFLHALRDVESDIRSWRRSPLRSLLEAAAAVAAVENDLDDVRQAMEEANEQINKLEVIEDLSRRISNRTLEMVGQDQALDAELGVAPPDPLRLIRSMQLFVDGAARRQLASASLGTLNVLYLALLEIGLESRLRASEIAHVVLAVEEPEAHLHPHLQRLIFRRLLGGHTGSTTTLVTTQSPFIASVAPPQSLIALRTSGGRTVAAAASVADLEANEWADIARYLDATRAELVFARRVLLVEGYGELVLMPALASSLGLDLDKLGITVCAIYGTHFAAYARFSEALKIPWSIITDGDIDDDGTRQGDLRAQRLVERLRSAASAEELGVFVGESTLEYDLFHASASNRTKCLSVLQELASLRQREEISSWDGSDPGYDAYMLAVRKVGGKGRFAQRLSLHQLDAPRYVRLALEYLSRQ